MQDTVPLYVFPLSVLNVMQSPGLGDTFEIEVDDKVFLLHSPDIKEAKDWYQYLLTTSREARVCLFFTSIFFLLKAMITFFFLYRKNKETLR
jgi:hypothetical protein